MFGLCSTYVGRDSDVRLGQLEKAMSEMASSEVGSARLPREKDTGREVKAATEVVVTVVVTVRYCMTGKGRSLR